MYRYYKTSVKSMGNYLLPDPEPKNWLGYRHDDAYYLKTKEQMDAKELSAEDLINCPIKTDFLKDQFP